ncbi:MAG: hypothetical protein FJ279_15390 [Planctomycetes bacterium]|nr:hypothetical protein [Planctomycetota bacterium]
MAEVTVRGKARNEVKRRHPMMSAVMVAASLAFACAAFAADKPLGENWLDEPGFEKVEKKDSGQSIRTLPGGYTASGGTAVDWVADAHSGRTALALTPAADKEWFRFPIIIPGGQPRTFVFHFWARTDCDANTGDAASFYLHMSTPGFVGAGGGFPRTRFRYLKEWTHIGGTVTTDANTLGWFRFILYTTKPGLRILIDDAFFAEVTGWPQERIKALLGDATVTPRMALEPPTGTAGQVAKGNKLANASFELPANCGWAEFGGGKLQQTSLVTDDAAHGKACVRVNRLWHQRVALRPFSPHTFSAFFKPAQGKTVQVELLNAYSEGYRTKAAQIAHTFKLAEGWQRYSFTFTPPPNPAQNAYALRITGNVLMDAAQLEEGELTDFAPKRHVEFGLSTGAPFNLFLTGEPGALVLSGFNNAAKPAEEKALVALQDYWGRDVWKETVQIAAPAGEAIRFQVPLPQSLRGALRAQVRVDNEVLAEQVVSIVPPPRKPGLAPESLFGALVKFSDENLTVSRRLGIKWSRDHWSFCWYKVEPEPGKWIFTEADAAIDRALAHGVSVFGVLHGTPSWASRDGQQSYTSIPKDWTQWERYVEQVVSHFKGKVKVWEVWNEPQSATLYYDLCRHSYAAAKRANPDCLVIGCSSTLYSSSFLKEFVQLGGLQHLDEVSAHVYHYSANLREVFEKYSGLLGGRRVWNTEGGGWGGSTFYSTRLDHKPERPGVQQVGRYYTTFAATPIGRMQCYYWNVWPADYTPGYEYTWTFFEYDSSVKPEGVAYAVTAHELEGAKFVATLSEDNLRMHLFERDGASTAALWWEGEGVLKLSLPACDAAVRRRDIMGNDTAFAAVKPFDLEVDKDVQFLHVPLPPSQTRAILARAKPDKPTAAKPELVITYGGWQARALEGGDTFALGYHGGDPKGVFPVVQRDAVLGLGIVPTEHPKPAIEQTDQPAAGGQRLVIANENQNARLSRAVSLHPDRAEIEFEFRSLAAQGKDARCALHLAASPEAVMEQDGGFVLKLPTGERLKITFETLESSGLAEGVKWELATEGAELLLQARCREFVRGARWRWKATLRAMSPSQNARRER